MRVIYWLLAVMLLASCTSSAVEPTVVYTPSPSSTLTNTPIPTLTKSPTSTPAIPTATITPMTVATVSASPLTLTELNAGTEMKRLNVIGTGTPNDIKFSPDGKQLAVATGRGVYLYDGATFEQDGFIDVNDSVSAIAFSPDGNVLAIGVKGNVALWNVISGKSVLNFEGGMVSIFKLVYGNGGFVAAMGGDCQGCGSQQLAMVLWDAKTGQQIFSQHDIYYATKALAFTNDGKQLIFGGQGGLTVIESETGKQIATYNKSTTGISSAVDSPLDFISTNDGSRFFVTSLDATGEIFDITTQTHQPFTICGVYLTGNSTNGLCPINKRMIMFDLTNGGEIKSIDISAELEDWRSLFALSPTGNYLVYLNKSVLSVMDIQSRQIIKTLDFIDSDNASTGIVDIDGVEKYVVALVASSGQVSVFDLQTGLEIRRFQSNCCEITGFAFAPDRKTAAMIDTNNLRLWDLQSNQIIYEADVKDDFSGPIAFLPDGSSILLTHNSEDYILEFNLQTRQSINRGRNKYDVDYFDPFVADNYHFNTRGYLIMLDYETNGDENYPIFSDAVTNEKIVLPYNTFPIFLEAFAISSDGKYLAFGDQSGIYVWDLKTLKLQAKLTGHEERYGDGWSGKIRRVLFSPQSNLLVSVGWDGTTRLWNIFAGTELRRLKVCCSASFTPDGRYLVTAGDGVIRVWGIQQ